MIMNLFFAASGLFVGIAGAIYALIFKGREGGMKHQSGGGSAMSVNVSHRSIALVFALLVLLIICIAALRPPRVETPQLQPIQPPVVVTQVQAQAQPPARIAIDPNAGYSAPVTYPQVGYMKEGAHVLPVYGRPSFTRSGRGFYYTIIPTSGIKVPLFSSNRDCMEDIGCEDLYTSDQVTVPDSGLGRDRQWKVVIYKYNRT